MKKELYDYSAEEATEYMNYEGIRELDYVETEGYKLFGKNIQETVKLRVYEDRTFKLEVLVPEEIQCVPCELKYKTKNLDACPCCGTTSRDVMLRNKVQDDVADNFSLEHAEEAYNVARKEFDDTVKELEPYGFVFKEGIFKQITEAKEKEINVKVMKELMGDDASAQAILDFSK